MINFLKRSIVYIVLFFISLYFVYPYIGKDFRIIFGEGPMALNPNYLNFFYLWQDKINLGYPFHSQSLIFLFAVIWKFLNLFSFVVSSSLIYVMICGYFLAGIFFYLTLKTLFPVDNQSIYLPPVLLYIFNMYRISSGNSDENILLFISLPLFFLLYYKLLNEQKWRYVFLLTILSILSSTMGKNVAIISIPYILMIIYFIYILFSGGCKNQLVKILKMNLTLAILIGLSSLFWVLPQYVLLQNYYADTESGKTLWAVLGSGTFFDHFRFMGFWAFRDAGYFPYSPLYYQPVFILTTYLISILSFSYLFFIKDKKLIHLKIFIAILSIVSYLLLSGNKGSIGFLYQILYDHISIFKMFREPYGKFTPLFIFAVSFGLLFSIYYLSRYLKNGLLRAGFIFILSITILFNAWPIFKIIYAPKSTQPKAPSGIIVKIPDYWYELNRYFQRLKTNQWLLVFQNIGYGSNSNWQYGINVVGNVAEYITNSNVKIIRNLGQDPSDATKVINNIFKNNYQIVNLKAYLGLLNSQYILQENDAEWRYTGDLVKPPSQSNKIIREKGFFKVAEFGKLTPEYLSKISNINPDVKVKNQLYSELINHPGLILYKMEDKYFVPTLYTPKKIIVSSQQVKDLNTIVDKPDFVIPSVIFLTRQNATVFAYNYFDSIKKNLLKPAYQPIIEFKKVNPIKYQLIIHQARDTFPLVFSTNFSSDWKIYLKSKSQPPVNHLLNNKLDSYRNFPGNEEAQANKREVKSFINKKWISTSNKLTHFISKNFQNTIQNDNISSGNFYETWLMKQAIDEKFHLTANGYANAWIIDPTLYCLNYNCRKNLDGSYDFELILEYSPQKYFWFGFAICVLILTISITFIVIEFLLNKKGVK